MTARPGFWAGRWTERRLILPPKGSAEVARGRRGAYLTPMADRPDDHPRGPGPRLGPGVAVGIDEAMIRTLVHAFYGRVREDRVLGPIFDGAIGEAWDAHLAKLCDFWSSVMLATGRFQGRPMQAHNRLPGIRTGHFGRWLALFEVTAREVCPPAAAALFIERSRMIGRSLELGLAVSRGELPPSNTRV